MTTPKIPRRSPTTNAYAKYSVMGFQFAAVIGAGVYGGMKLDEWLGFKKIPVFTVVLSLTGVGAAMYLVIKDVLKKK